MKQRTWQVISIRAQNFLLRGMTVQHFLSMLCQEEAFLAKETFRTKPKPRIKRAEVIVPYGAIDLKHGDRIVVQQPTETSPYRSTSS